MSSDSGRLLDARGLTQCIGFIGLFPGEVGMLAAEVTVSGSFFIDRSDQVEHGYDAVWA